MKYFLIFFTFILVACDAPVIKKQASLENCRLLINVFENNMNTASLSEGVDKLYYLKIAEMNLNISMDKGCCKYQETCMAMINSF
jgi:hypothetical protein